MRNDKLKIALCAHVEIPGPVQALEEYVSKNYSDWRFTEHPLLTMKSSRIIEKGKKREIWNPPFRMLAYPWQVKLNILFNFKKSDVFIGIDPLNAFCGILLKFFGRTKKVIYYVIDYTPKRFTNPILNSLYHSLDRFCSENSDCVWCISQRILEQKKKFKLKKGIVVPVGVYFDKINYENEKIKDSIVLLSHLTKDKGVQIAIKAMKDVSMEFPNSKLFIIGKGPYEKELRKLAKELKLDKNIEFLGFMDHDEAMKNLSKFEIALAPYEDDPDSITYYADPTKPKEYLAAGLPLIITRVPWIAEEVEKKSMGKVINYNDAELAGAIKKLLADSSLRRQMGENAKNFMKNFSWERIYEEALNL